MTKMRKTVRLNAVPSDLSKPEQAKVIDLALNILTERHLPGQALTNPTDTIEYLRIKLADYKNEVFCALFLDNRHRVLAFEELFFGTINGASVHPRVVIQRTMEINAGAVIFAHNHPSGIAEPSHADRTLTTRLKKALDYVDVRVLDHIVVGAEGTTSFAQTGLL